MDTDYSSFTSQQLQNVKKPQLIDYILSLKVKQIDEGNKLLNDISEKLDKLNDKFVVQEHVLNLVKKENKKLKDRISDLEEQLLDLEDRVSDTEKDINETERYIRRNNIEIHGIPKEIKNEKLEDVVISIGKKVGVDFSSDNIEACHRLKRKGGTNPVIVRFLNRRFCERLHASKKKLWDLSFNEMDGFSEDSKIFFGENLCPYYQKLFSICYKLKKNRLIHAVWTFQGEVFYKINENDFQGLVVKDEEDLFSSFPDFFDQI